MNLVFIMNTAFPYGQAYSSRARYFTRLFCALGYHVHIIAPSSNNPQECPELNSVDYTCEYVNTRNDFLNLAGFGTAIPYIGALRKYFESHNIDVVISSSMVHVTDKIRQFCSKNHVPYFIEQCEWFDKSTFKMGSMNPYYREHIRSIMRKNKKCDGIIAISRLLEDHYSSQNVKVIRIPTILDKETVLPRLDRIEDRPVRIVFAGSLGNGKELLQPIISGIQADKCFKKKIVVDIYGPTYEQLLSNIGGNIDLLKKVSDSVFIHGRIPQRDVEAVLREADYSIFIRPNRQSSNAGFPTKLAESMMVGTPVITNATGDISLYIDDGENGFVIDKPEENEVVNVFKRIIKMDNEAHSNMRKVARVTAEKAFDYRTYIKDVNNLINTIHE